MKKSNFTGCRFMTVLFLVKEMETEEPLFASEKKNVVEEPSRRIFTRAILTICAWYDSPTFLRNLIILRER
jgi:hypothetical protein